MSVQVVTTAADLITLEIDYERLQAATGNVSPFALHEWHVAWLNHLLQSTPSIDVEPIIHVFRNSEGECVAIVPLIRTRRRLGPFAIAYVDFLGADPAITEIRTCLIETGYEGQVRVLLQASLRRAFRSDWVHWRAAGSQMADQPVGSSRLERQESLAEYVLELPATWELLRTRLKRNIRESIRHCYNSLKRDGLTFEIRMARSPDAVAASLPRFFELHAMRAQFNLGVSHPDHFRSRVAREFLQEVCARLAQRERVRIVEMSIGGEVVAMRIVFVVANSAYLYYSGFDPRWSKYGVMTTTVTEIIKRAIDEGLDSINFSTGKDVSKTRWGPREVFLEHMVQVATPVYSRLGWIAFRTMTSTRPKPRWFHWLSSKIKRTWN